MTRTGLHLPTERCRLESMKSEAFKDVRDALIEAGALAPGANDDAVRALLEKPSTGSGNTYVGWADCAKRSLIVRPS